MLLSRPVSILPLRTLRFVLFACFTLLLIPSSSQVALAKASDIHKDFRKQIKAKQAKERKGAFEALGRAIHPKTIDVLIKGVEELRKHIAKNDKERVAAEKQLEKAITDLEAARAAFEAGKAGPREIEKLNKRSRKLRREREEALRIIRVGQDAWLLDKLELAAASQAAARVLDGLGDEDRTKGLALLTKAWRDKGKDPTAPGRYVDVLFHMKHADGGAALAETLRVEGMQPGTRAYALVALGSKGAPETFEIATKALALGKEHMPVLVAAIEALRSLHVREAIAPLMEFLGRRDIGRARGDARNALISLTGQTHGPYRDPWQRWWDKNKDKFEMPAAPQPPKTEVEGEDGVTFYGIQTFSERILFIIDISGSMDWSLTGGPDTAGTPNNKMKTAREELYGAISRQSEGHQFGLILFNHGVNAWNAKPVTVAKGVEKQVRAFLDEIQPQGLTNIHDALELGFREALKSTGAPYYDTVFFLTDGKPTAGRLLDTEAILEAVSEWNRAAHMQIHVIGVGTDLEPEFLEALAALGKGSFVWRGKPEDDAKDK